MTTNESSIWGLIAVLAMFGDFIVNIVIWPFFDRRSAKRKQMAEADEAMRVAEELAKGANPEVRSNSN